MCQRSVQKHLMYARHTGLSQFVKSSQICLCDNLGGDESMYFFYFGEAGLWSPRAPPPPPPPMGSSTYMSRILARVRGYNRESGLYSSISEGHDSLVCIIP